ncbi:MAG: hypothetical protein Kow0098_06250 [Ignavibacteriaceae bacterium]
MIVRSYLLASISVLLSALQFVNAQESSDSLKSNDSTITKTEIPAGLTAEEVVSNYIAEIGGKEALSNVNDRTTVMRGSVQGQNITLVIYQKSPDRLRQEINVGTMKQTIIFDGEKAAMLIGEQKMDITGDELQQLKLEANINLLLDYENYGVRTELTGVKKVNGKDAYEIRLTSPDSLVWFQYYDPESWLKVKEIRTVSTPQGEFQQELFFDDYKEIEGLKFPFTINQNMGIQSLQFKVSSIKVNSGIPDDKFVISE